MADDPNSYNFNGEDYEFIIRIYNGTHDIYLKPEAWDDLIFEEDIFNWMTTGSITIKTPYDSFERSSDIANTQHSEQQSVYKFRNDGRDTIYITIKPKATSSIATDDYEEPKWRIELDCAIFEVEDLDHGNYSNKMKKLYFWEKTYQMMREKNIEFSTALVGTNKEKTGIEFLGNNERGLPTGEAIGELLATDEEFATHAENYKNKINWNMGDPENKMFYTSPTNYRFTDDLEVLKEAHTSDKDSEYQPCIFKFERPEEKGKPRQFSLMSIKEYFAKAGKSDSEPGEYQIEHLFLEEHEENSAIPVVLKKSPVLADASLNKDVTADNFSRLKSFQLIDFSGIETSTHLQNTFMVSRNTEKGQFNIEIKEHKSEKYKEFAEKNIYSQVVTTEQSDRIPYTKYIKNAYNSKYVYSPRQKEFSRIADGRNKMLQHYLFNNLGIAFSRPGLTIRQPGRFFSLSKESQNNKEYDNKLEGQYFILNVVHHFRARNYTTTVTAVKAHTYGETTKFEPNDLILIAPATPTNDSPDTAPTPTPNQDVPFAFPALEPISELNPQEVSPPTKSKSSPFGPFVEPTLPSGGSNGSSPSSPLLPNVNP